MTDPLVVVVLDALAGARDPALGAALGTGAEAALRAVLRRRTRAWAQEAAGGGAVLEATRADELAEALAGRTGPVLLVGPDVPALSAHHLSAARDDLAAGVLFTSAPSGDGTPFLIALARPAPELLALVGAPFEDIASTAVALGGELGMLRAERRLASLADARAVRADPLAPAELRDLLAALDD